MRKGIIKYLLLLALNSCSQEAAYNLGYLAGLQFSHSLDLNNGKIINTFYYYPTRSCTGYVYYNQNNENMDIADCIILEGVSYISFHTTASIINAFNDF